MGDSPRNRIKVLVANDDGYDSPGLKAICLELLSRGMDVKVYTPAEQRSGFSHCISMSGVFAEPFRFDGDMAAVEAWKVYGTPADCVKLGITRTPWKPEIVVSGMNIGLNFGLGYIYSGTMAAAREGAINGVQAVGVSVDVDSHTEKCYWEDAAIIAANIVMRVLEQNIQEGRIISVNIPNIPLKEYKGIKWTRQGNSWYNEKFVRVEMNDQDRERAPKTSGHLQLFKFQGDLDQRDHTLDFDYPAVKSNYVTLTAMDLHFKAPEQPELFSLPEIPRE